VAADRCAREALESSRRLSAGGDAGAVCVADPWLRQQQRQGRAASDINRHANFQFAPNPDSAVTSHHAGSKRVFHPYSCRHGDQNLDIPADGDRNADSHRNSQSHRFSGTHRDRNADTHGIADADSDAYAVARVDGDAQCHAERNTGAHAVIDGDRNSHAVARVDGDAQSHGERNTDTHAVIVANSDPPAHTGRHPINHSSRDAIAHSAAAAHVRFQ
jgi:hypothetical protein